MDKLISIIIPCYNVEAFIDRCLNSLVNQTIGIEKLELIFVDDASKDKTWDKIKDWERKYPESIIITQHGKNMKQGAARNTGLQYASAPYIGFVDSDDWTDITMFEKLYDVALKYETDLAGCYSIRVVNESEHGKVISSEPILCYYDSDEEKRELMKHGIYGGVYCWIYRREIIFDNQILFPQYISYEDNYWKDILKLYIHSSVLLQEELYYYFQNDNSTIMNRNSLALMDRLSIEEKKLAVYKEFNIFELYYAEIEYNFVRLYFINTIFMILSRCDSFPLSMFNHMNSKLHELFPGYSKNEYLFSELSDLDRTILKLSECDMSQSVLNQLTIKFQKQMLKLVK